MPAGGRVSSAKPKLPLLSPGAATLSGYSAAQTPGPQPASETRTKEPTRYKRTPRVIHARSTNLFKDSSTRCFYESLTTSGAVLMPEQSGINSRADFFRPERFATFRVKAGTDVNQGDFP